MAMGYSTSSGTVFPSLNASLPGNQVAHLLIQLAPSATPGILTLTLDPTLTQPHRRRRQRRDEGDRRERPPSARQRRRDGPAVDRRPDAEHRRHRCGRARFGRRGYTKLDRSVDCYRTTG